MGSIQITDKIIKKGISISEKKKLLKSINDKCCIGVERQENCNNSSRKTRREEVAEDVDGKSLILHFVNFLFREVSNKILGDRRRERSELSEV